MGLNKPQVFNIFRASTVVQLFNQFLTEIPHRLYSRKEATTIEDWRSPFVLHVKLHDNAKVISADEFSFFTVIGLAGGFWRSMYFIFFLISHVFSLKYYKASLIEDVFMVQNNSVDPDFTCNPTENSSQDDEKKD